MVRAPHILPRFFHSTPVMVLRDFSLCFCKVRAPHIIPRFFHSTTCGVFITLASVCAWCADLICNATFLSSNNLRALHDFSLCFFMTRALYIMPHIFHMPLRVLFVTTASVSVRFAHLTSCRVFSLYTRGLFVISASVSVCCANLTFCRVFSLITCGLFVTSASVSVWCAHLTFCRVFFTLHTRAFRDFSLC
jgi:hypothetical protein